MQELVDANALDASGVILPGQTLRIPRPVVVATVASVSVALSDEMRQNAQLIVDVGRSLGVPDQGIVIALAAAAAGVGTQESCRTATTTRSASSSSVRARDGAPSTRCSTPCVRRPRSTAAPRNPNPGRTRGLLDIAGWEAMTVTQAAQAVQQSAHPDHYAKWEASARAWLSELG